MRSKEFVKEKYEKYTSMNKYGIYTTKSKDGDFELWQHDKHLGSFKTIQDLDAYLQDYLDGSSSLRDDAEGGIQSVPNPDDAGLRFQGLFKVGDKIRAYDFQPAPDREDRYVVGTVVKTDADSRSQPGAKGYHIEVEKDQPGDRRVGQTVFVPYEIGMDYGTRINRADEQDIEEGMGFHAATFDKEKNQWDTSLDSGDRYEKDFYRTDWPQNQDPKDNPEYKPEWDIHLSNHNAREVMGELGYPTDLEDQSPFPIDEFIAKSTQWLQKAIGKPSPEEPTTVDRSGGGATMYSGGKPEGYYNRVIKMMNQMARDGKAHGATHVYMA